MKLNLFFFLLIGLVLLSNVSALGITPGRTTVSFEPTLEKVVAFDVINTEKEATEVVFSVRGELAKYISLSNNFGIFANGEEIKPFEYKINLPTELEPGFHSAEVVVLKAPKGSTLEGTTIEATVSVVTQVYVYVPYPGKYIESDLEVYSSEESNTIEFHFPFVSRGEEEISKVSAKIDIFGGEEKIITLETNSLSAKTNDRKELFVSWNPEVDDGEYWALATINYDGQEITHEESFSVGKENLGLVSIGVKDFELGDIAKIRILVENRLKDPVQDVFASLKILNSGSIGVADVKSVDYNLAPESREELVVYWDTEGVKKGLYDLELGIHKGEKSTNKDFKIDVREDDIVFTGVGFVVAGSGDGKVSTTTVILLVAGFLILINLFWIVVWLKGKNNSKKKK